MELYAQDSLSLPCKHDSSNRKVEDKEADGHCDGEGDGVLLVCHGVDHLDHPEDGEDDQGERQPVGED